MSQSPQFHNTSPPPYSAIDPRQSYGAVHNGNGTTSRSRSGTPAANPPSRPDSNRHPLPRRQFLKICFLVIGIFLAVTGMITLYHLTRFFITPTTWINLNGSPICTSIGTRTYTAILSHIPEGYHRHWLCSYIPITIHGRNIPHPASCYSEPIEREVYKDGELRNVTHTITRGKWVVDFDEGGCIPTWDPLPAGVQNPTPDSRCQSYRIRGYTAFMSPSRVPPGLEALHSCRNTPATIHGRQVLPDECQLEQTSTGADVLRARFTVEEPSCTPHWYDVQRDWRCERYGLKRFSGLLEERKDLDSLEACREIPYRFFGVQDRKPDSCEREGSGRIRGYWMIDFNVPECHPVLKDIWDHVSYH
ncbi:hypothetical protein V5O48_010746 [Marasmius crinis-equi]|uniref:Uncharacterized protein n=1 Tax=Marasmius crinis-equi TaxID=585013 RepID=A0ABR3F7Z4_9AGAR